MRLLYAMSHVSTDFAAMADESDDPTWTKQQLFVFFSTFIAGKRFHIDKPLPAMKHMNDGIWEFKTPTLRLFGFFPQKDSFIITRIVPKIHLIPKGNYKIAINSCRDLRDALDLDAPKFIQSTSQDDVIQS